MIQMLVEALKSGKIIAVDWQDIDEMLGEAPKLEVRCSICDNSESFPPAPEKTHNLQQEEVVEVLRQAGPQWISFDYVGDSPLSRFKTRYFSVNKPIAGQWLKNPNKP